jgi:sialic acid synthase SpsE
MVAAVREAHAALGDGVKAPRAAEDDVRRVARRSLVVTRRLRAGEQVAVGDLDAMRPEGGISPLRLDAVVGRRAAHDLVPGTVLLPRDLDPPLDEGA